MSQLAFEPIRPSRADVTSADKALHHVREYLTQHRDQQEVSVVVDSDPSQRLVVPRSAIELLARVLAHMAAGQGVSVVPANAELTSQQAADLLNVSRPHLIGLLDAGEIEYRKVGTHRRIQAESLLEYMRRDDKRRRAAADELTNLAQEMGL